MGQGIKKDLAKLILPVLQAAQVEKPLPEKPYRMAPKIVTMIFEAMTAALKRGEEVVLPFGILRWIETPQRAHRRWRFGQPQSVFRRRYRVALQPRVGSESEEE